MKAYCRISHKKDSPIKRRSQFNLRTPLYIMLPQLIVWTIEFSGYILISKNTIV